MKKLKLLTQNFQVKKVTQIDLKSYLTKRAPKIEIKNEFSSFTPPEVFVGRFGYPKVFVGPIMTNSENPEEYVLTEKWFGKSFSEIADLMLTSIRGERLVNIYDIENKIVQKIHESLLSKSYSEIEAKILKIKRKCFFHEDSKPYGPIALIEDFKVNSCKSDQRVEKVYYDKDLKACDAILNLYFNKVEVSKIQQYFSAGMLGIKRKLVPTRWSITAVDDTISKFLISKIKEFNEINEIRIYNLKYLANNWVIILLPLKWNFEYIELFYPKTVFKNYFAIGGDYEIGKPIERYAEIGGCYYAARLAVSEKLFRERVQATAIVLREVYSDYLFPVGVWNVRESVRNALNQNYEKFDNVNDALKRVKELLKTDISVWLKNSFLFRALIKDNLKVFVS